MTPTKSDRTIASLSAHEILDSRGWPTVQVTLALEDGTTATASVPSGASTGQNEAHELRDGDPKRYAGRGVLKACQAVESELSQAVRGRDVTRQAEIDAVMRHADGTPNKGKLGANAILGVSMAAPRGAALSTRQPLYTHLGGATARRLDATALDHHPAHAAWALRDPPIDR